MPPTLMLSLIHISYDHRFRFRLFFAGFSLFLCLFVFFRLFLFGRLFVYAVFLFNPFYFRLRLIDSLIMAGCVVTEFLDFRINGFLISEFFIVKPVSYTHLDVYKRQDDPFYIRCGATLKHFYANNVEKDRISISSSLDRRNKYEYYLEPFRKAIVEGGAEAVMTSYNEINGIPAIVNEEVRTILKEAWGLPGHVVCDLSLIHI